MADKKFAFESGKVSIAFRFVQGLGDAVVAVKIFDALVELAPDCLIDIFCMKEHHRPFAKAFFGDRKNLNRISDFNVLHEKYSHNYDLSLWVLGTHAVILDAANVEGLQRAPKLLQAAELVEQYNQENVYEFKPWSYSLPLRNVNMARILQKNFHWFLSCAGALPVREAGSWLKPSPKFLRGFKNLKLGRYVTIYSNIWRNSERTKIKTWPMRCLVEYVGLIKKFFPQVAVVQLGASDDAEIANVDKNFLGYDLELTKHILANSLLHVGCEGGLIHLATALGTKCLVLFGASDWRYFGYPQNINIVSEVCAPCLYVTKTFGCFFNAKELPCMADITAQDAFRETSEYLGKINE